MTIQLFTESAAAQLKREKQQANRDYIDEKIANAFNREIEREVYPHPQGYEHLLNIQEGRGKFLAECVMDHLSDQEYPVIYSFVREIFDWVDAHHDELIPAKYSEPYLILKQIKQHLKDDN